MSDDPDDGSVEAAADAPAADALPQLDEVEQRVIGSLLEKEVTVPASYPLTLNSLRTACNQSSSREPVTDLDDVAITGAIDRLKARGLARMVYAASGARAVKYRQVLDERLQLEDDERAVLTVLFLRGPQAPGELKARTDRLHEFGDRAEVEALLAAMATRRRGALVRELERQPGQHDARWIHLLGPVDVGVGAPASAAGSTAAEPSASAAAEREVVLAHGATVRDDQVRTAYDAMAGGYAEALVDELDGKPFDRWLLERLADLADGGPVADVGCGPGHVADHLAMAGAEVTGFDLSPEMVAEAHRRFPELAVEVGDLWGLPDPVGSERWAAIAAWYSLVHLAGSELRPAVGVLVERLAPGGWLALALHVGDGTRHPEELFGVPVDLTFVLHDRAEVLAAIEASGLVDVEWYLRSWQPSSGEAETERLYVLARRPSAQDGPS